MAKINAFTISANKLYLQNSEYDNIIFSVYVRSEHNNGQYVTGDADKAELLNSYFSSVNVQDDGRNPTFKRCVADEVKIDTVQFSPARLLKICKKLNSETTGEPDVYSNFY